MWSFVARITAGTLALLVFGVGASRSQSPPELPVVKIPDVPLTVVNIPDVPLTAVTVPDIGSHRRQVRE
ncbi:hypothetical protein [Fimbriiglobus ruber]|uniref:hypothetical protein n=1 Tax=Fimbriiglobus ruber TaxID=1908690 RepID=UPI000B4B081F|nr:hypothetical protein [Fimbriiglobus ruber]